VAGAFVSPNGITLNSYNPSIVMKAVLERSSGLISTCQYPDAKSNVEKYLAFPSVSSKSSILGNGNWSLVVTLFSYR